MVLQKAHTKVLVEGNIFHCFCYSFQLLFSPHAPRLQSNSIATSFFEKLILSGVMQKVSTKTKRKSASVKIKGDSLLWKLWTCVGGGVEPQV